MPEKGANRASMDDTARQRRPRSGPVPGPTPGPVAGPAALPGRRLGAVVALTLALLPGCKRAGGENFGQFEPAVVPSAAPGGVDLTRADLLLQLLSISHAEVTARLGPHRIESQTRWSITPVVVPGAGAASGTSGAAAVRPGFRPDSPAQLFDGGAAFESVAVTLEETRSIAVDAAGRLQLASQNDHGTGVEAVLDQSFLYLRMRYAPYIRYKPEGDQVNRLRASAYESGAALLEAVAPYVRLSAPTEATVVGLPAWRVSLSQKDVPAGVREKGPSGPLSAWRGTTAVDILEGTVTVDRQKGTLLTLRLHERFVATRPSAGNSATTERVQVEVDHQVQVVAIGAGVPAITPPAEWIDPPTRPRPMLDRQELLNGLLPGRPEGRP